MEDVESKLNKLISLIYDTALEPTLWPELLEQLVEVIGLTQQENNTLTQQHPARKILLEHLQRSVEVSEKLQLGEAKSHDEQMLLHKLPFPVLILSSDGRLLQQNQHAQKFISEKKILLIRDNKLSIDSKLLQREFEQIIAKLVQPAQQCTEYSMRLRDKYQTVPISLNVSLIGDQHQRKGNILLLVASYDPEQLPDTDIIATHFSLTPAEARLLEKLISTKTLHQIADAHQVSIHTVRSQLKSILKKTGCHRQSELIKMIISSPLLSPSNVKQSLLAQHHLNAPCFHNKITLQDGRKLSYSDTGLRSGVVVIFLHPSTGSRLQRHPDESILFKNKIRVIAPDRPGFGLSDPKHDLTLLNYADDLCELVDQLQVERFVLAGYCGGAPYALASTMKLSKRVMHTLLISSVSPYEQINLFYGVKSSNKLLAKLALNFPSALQTLLKLMARNLLINPERYFDQVYPHLCESDAAALSEPEVTDNILLALREAMRQGTSAVSQDLYLLSQAWGVDFSQITQPISIWHGTLDQHVPVNLIQKLHRALPNATLHKVAGHGHLLIYYRWQEILQSLKIPSTKKSDKKFEKSIF